ncbi:response regulator [Halomontanus rarus]|uniref:response regulator n=1 Tax=Halomontanus rarus TaxID=3034020 RepID=UPI00293B91F6|nr:response regulator [Halovivax sp. KZCA124]
MDDPNNFGSILLVEDNPGDVRWTKEMLKEAGLNPTVHVVTDGPEALDFIRQRGEYANVPRPDVVLLDLHLPRMDGDEVLTRLGDEVSDIPIVALSGSQRIGAVKLEDMGDRVAARLEKPIEPDEVRDVVQLVDDDD